MSIAYGIHNGVIVPPFAAFVRQRVAQELEQWQREVPADCIFFDQLGARPWLRDFNPAAPNPIAYDDGWVALLAPYTGRCLMVEDGWDRLARDFSGFHGSLLMMERELDLPDSFFGAGNWQPFPLADWLFHDKVLLYQHDLYDGTMATDGEVLLWNMAFGMISSFSWDGDASLANPWLELAARLQHDLGPRYAGVAFSGYRNLAPQVTESGFGDLSVVANWNRTDSYSTDGYDLAPEGFLARTKSGDVLAGAFSGSFDGVPLSPGTHYLVLERNASAVTVRQPVGADTNIAVATNTGDSRTGTLHATAIGADGAALGTVPAALQPGRVVFAYTNTLNGRRVEAYRIDLSS